MDELSEYREQIDRIDRELVRLFEARMAVTGRVGEYKLRQGLPVLDPGREREVLAEKAALTRDDALKADVVSLFESIMALSRRQQRALVREGVADPAVNEIKQNARTSRRTVIFP